MQVFETNDAKLRLIRIGDLNQGNSPIMFAQIVVESKDGGKPGDEGAIKKAIVAHAARYIKGVTGHIVDTTAKKPYVNSVEVGLEFNRDEKALLVDVFGGDKLTKERGDDCTFYVAPKLDVTHASNQDEPGKNWANPKEKKPSESGQGL